MPANFPDSPTIGQSFTLDERIWTWDGTVWESDNIREFNRIVSDTAPTSPSVGDEWFNSTTGRLYNYYDGYWIEIGAAIGGADGADGKFFASAVPPESPEQGMAWFHTETAKLYVYYDNFWVEASPPAEGPQGPTGPAGPAGADGVDGTNGTNGTDGQDGVAAATAPLAYDAGTRTISIDLSSYYNSSETDSAISTALAGLVDSAPSTLDTLNELAAALGDDPSFATTITNQIADKVDTSTYQTTAAPSTAFSVVNNGASAYTINGSDNPTLSLMRGQKYVFNVNASGHPFHIQTVDGAYSSGNVYSTGITGDGAQTTALVFQVPLDAPDTLYYVCEFHSSMQGQINIADLDDKVNNKQAISAKTGAYTLVAADNQGLITCNGTFTVTVPSGTFTGGERIDFINIGTGTITFTGSGVTVNAKDGALTLTAQYTAASLVFTSATQAYLVGSLG